MAAIWVTGSADGIGREAAATMVAAGHRVVLHARDEARAAQALAAVPGADGVLVGDLGSIDRTRELAAAAEKVGPFDAIVHNAGYRGRAPQRPASPDGLELTFAVNILAPYLLTALGPRPNRLVYLTSRLHTAGSTDLSDLQWHQRTYDPGQAYNDSKLYLTALALAIAKRWPAVRSNAVDPGWVRSRMGGDSAPSSLADGAATPIWLATSPEAADVTGQYLSTRESGVHPGAEALGDAVLAECARITGVTMPA